ncbi:MAG: amino acid permease [Planctomycetota bacterium]|nr:amino acid permease [Planctomycetota bacterium]
MKLKRKLGFWSVFCIAAGAMISSGLFVLPGLAYAQAGPGIVLAYALAGLMVLPAMLSQAELATAMPKSGGSYFFIERSMGALPGTLAGLANWFSIALKSAFALIGIGAFTRLIWGQAVSETTIRLVAIGACVFFAGLNILSVKGVGRFQIVMVAFLLAILLVFLFFGMPTVHHKSFEKFTAAGMGTILAAAGLVFVSFGGLTKVASIAGEVRNPGRNLPGGMFLAMAVVWLFYVAAVFVAVGVLTPKVPGDPSTSSLCKNLTPLSTTAEVFLGRSGAILLACAAMLAFFTTANSGILSASRSPMAMSHDGLLPQFVRRISHKTNTPWVSILLTSVFMIALIAALPIENLVKVASTMMLMLFLLVNVAVLIMRGSKIQNYRPLYHSPFYPWLQVAGIAIYAMLIVLMGTAAHLTTAAFALGGLLWYIIYVRPHIYRESALLYIVRKAVSKEIYRSQLEEELRGIALERDEVIHDRFDRLVQQCAILDIDEPIPAEEMFRRAAELLAPRLKMDKDHLLEAFKEREVQSSTVIQPGLAIPHIIVAGKELFDILLVRCRGGISFAGQDEPVRTAFVLIGSADERNYHLRALMAIAHIVQERDFTSRWLEAPESEHLRDILLLSGRQRDV